MEIPTRVTTRQSTAQAASQPNEDDTTSVTVRKAQDEQLIVYLKEISLLEKDVLRSEDQAVALVSRSVTARHHNRALTIVESFLNCLREVGESCSGARLQVLLFFRIAHLSHFAILK